MDLLTDTPTPPAESSPAPVSGQSVLDALNPADRLTYEQTGEIPAPKDAPADSSPAAPDAQAGSTEPKAPPASEPGTPKTKGADARKAELHAEIQTLLQQRAQLRDEIAQRTPRPPDAPPASSPAPVSDVPQLKDFIARVGIAEGFETYEDAQQAFLDARDTYRAREHQRVQAQVAYANQVQEAVRTFADRRAKAIEADPTWSEKVAPSILNLKPHFSEPPGTPRRPDHDLAEGIVLSEHAPQVMAYLTEHPEVFSRLLQSPTYAIYRELGRIEAALTPSVPPPADKPVPKSLSSAPPPPVVLGTKPSVLEEDWKTAVTRGDFSAYERAMNRQPA